MVYSLRALRAIPKSKWGNAIKKWRKKNIKTFLSPLSLSFLSTLPIYLSFFILRQYQRRWGRRTKGMKEIRKSSRKRENQPGNGIVVLFLFVSHGSGSWLMTYSLPSSSSSTSSSLSPLLRFLPSHRPSFSSSRHWPTATHKHNLFFQKDDSFNGLKISFTIFNLQI